MKERQQYQNIWNNEEYPLNFKFDEDIETPEEGQVIGYCDIKAGHEQINIRYNLIWEQGSVISKINDRTQIIYK